MTLGVCDSLIGGASFGALSKKQVKAGGVRDSRKPPTRIPACFLVRAKGSIKQQIRNEEEAFSLQFLEPVMSAH
ncbi:uncharacterized protein CTRU02_207423 [Colletotrichum truncatum]|uniref:Uncharacterized protein n=1 Tax=Colletotrichum truncatum TaxID=5467 RepID=A0ACC3Z0S5_COLTU